LTGNAGPGETGDVRVFLLAVAALAVLLVLALLGGGMFDGHLRV
jgi:hypothetical protein